MLIETRHLLLVHAIAEQGGVTRASRTLSLTQSAVSHQLIELERKLGVRLFHRAGRRMVPTAAGQRVLQAAHGTLAGLRQLEEELRRVSLGQEAVVRLGTECHSCYNWLARKVADYRRQFPQVDVEIVADGTQGPLAALLDGRIDLAIVHDEPEDERIGALRLFRDELIIVARTDHRLARKRYVEVTDLQSEHLILYGTPLPETSFYRQVLAPAGVRPRKVSHITLTEAIIELVRAGLGVTVLERWAAAPYLRDGRLISLRLTQNGVPREWYAALIRKSPVPDHLREFIQMIRFGPETENGGG